MHRLVLILVFAAILAVNAQIKDFPDCKSGPLASFPIYNPSLAVDERATDLVSRMTIGEKATCMVNLVRAIPGPGLPQYEWWSEALHGVMYRKRVDGVPDATSFPVPLNLGATFNLNLIHRIANTISTEARAANNENITGLNFFTANINISRDPRRGRGQETPGEDPFLTSQYVYALVRGLQECEDKRYLKISVTCKHYVAYDLESWNGITRWNFNAQVPDQDLVETYLPPFERCIRDSQVVDIMCSLNKINGIPACAQKFFIETIVR